MSTIIKLRGIISLLLIIFTTSIYAQETNDDMVSKLYETYKLKGPDEVLKLYKKNNSNTDYEGLQEPLNILGYRLMQDDKDMVAAEVLLKAQIDEYPEEANPYDSYSDLLLEMGKQDEAVKYIEKSLAIAEQTDHIDNNLIIEAGKAKMAILENKDKQLNFLIGNWDNETTVYKNDKETSNSSGANNITFQKEGSVLIIDHDDSAKKPCCKRIMVYNPANDEFDIAFMGRNQPGGIATSKMKVKETKPGHYEFIEKFMDTDNAPQERKHEIIKENNSVHWVVFTSGENGWEKIRSMDLTKKD
ncbi:tetratricopeptide repeat protein [Christiangramia aquimixticola]|uniref:tetratricopeptide repeat protein n=1 Tax=Christiangramia aquimixticola TaxID=1697558 RepID=UPI003AA890E5